jgi:hypothetical protein
MKYCIVLILLISLFSCNQEPVNTTVQPYDSLVINSRMQYFDSVGASAYNSTRYIYPIADDTIPMAESKVKANREGVEISLDNGGKLTFNNATAGSKSFVLYRYNKILKPYRLVHITEFHNGWTINFLIRLKDGWRVDLWSAPSFSANREWFYTYSADLKTRDMPNGIQLFRIQGEIINKVFEKTVDDWEPGEMKWESDSTILIKRMKYDTTGKPHSDQIRMKIMSFQHRNT